ncbi:carbohydrate ABC transporter permease [Ruania alba]|uniref:Carbohydrate ABC transporter membrane protein 2, CUT1 family n=1 Tax=Ruania alba TaxID=648782 RepID=A0A1H5DRT2_9MICO|nr:carbohydrate ABC transporter permease [Ruania alba]SED81548.1 carbohydrate ABC transporter membrane protein 2, CUT1 family [Ruania alba]
MIVSRAERAMNYAVLIVAALAALAPIVLILVTSLQPGSSQSGLQPSNYAQAWVEGEFSQYLGTSVLVSSTVLAIALPCAVLAGYALGAIVFRGSTLVFGLFLLGIMVPAEAIVVPLFYDLRTLGLTNTLWAVALPQAAQSIAFGAYWMRTYFRTAPRSLIEAATLDGASERRVLWSILVPIGRPAIVTMTVLVFLWTWNEFLIPLVMSPNGDFRTAPLALALFQGQHVQATSLLAAAAVLVALPVVIVYLVLQRHVIAGMLEGSVRE